MHTYIHIHKYLDDLAIIKDQVLPPIPFCLLKNILTQHLMKQFHNTTCY